MNTYLPYSLTRVGPTVFVAGKHLPTSEWTPEERELCIERIRRDTVGQQVRGSTWEGLKQACADPRTWLFCLMQNLHIR